MGVTKSGFDELSGDLAKAARNAVPDVKKIVSKTSLEIKREAKRIIRANSHRGYLPHYPKSITYDLAVKGTLVESEIGPEQERLQGGLGRILEEGTVNNAPIPHLGPALDLQEGPFYAFLEELGEDLLEGRRASGPDADPE